MLLLEIKSISVRGVKVSLEMIEVARLLKISGLLAGI